MNKILPVLCRPVDASMGLNGLLELAETAGVKVVVFVEVDEIEVRSTSHHGNNAMVEELDGLPLPANPSDLALVIPILKTVVGSAGVTEANISKLDPERVGPEWAVLAEWLRARQGLDVREDLVQLMRVLESKRAGATAEDAEAIGFYRDLAALVSSDACASAEDTLRKLSMAEDGHRPIIRAASMLAQVKCMLDAIIAPPEGASTSVADAMKAEAKRKADAAAKLLDEAFAVKDHPCMRVATIASVSRIDFWRDSDALWTAHEATLPGPESCGAEMWSQELSMRAEVLLQRGRTCAAAETYAQAYGALRTDEKWLLAWAECDWLCQARRDAPRHDVLEKLRTALDGEGFQRPQQRVSIAYVRWWLTRSEGDAEAVLSEFANVKEGDVALIDGVFSGVKEICGQATTDTCAQTILTRKKRPGDETVLRRGLGLR